MRTTTLAASTPESLETLTKRYEAKKWERNGEKWHTKGMHYQVMVKFVVGPSETKHKK